MDLVKIASLHTGSCSRPGAPSESEFAFNRIGGRGLVSKPCGGVRDNSENGTLVPLGPPRTHEFTQHPLCCLRAKVISDRAVPSASAPRPSELKDRQQTRRGYVHPPLKGTWNTGPAATFPVTWEIGRHSVPLDTVESFEMLPFLWEELGRFRDSKGD